MIVVEVHEATVFAKIRANIPVAQVVHGLDHPRACCLRQAPNFVADLPDEFIHLRPCRVFRKFRTAEQSMPSGWYHFCGIVCVA